MPRRLITFKEGDVYHLIQNGCQGQMIFKQEKEKHEFLKRLQRGLQITGARLLHYVIMDSHYHLVVQMGEKSLSELMQRVNWSYSYYYNRSHNRHGTVFAGEFRSIGVYSRNSLRRLVRYIALNPVKAQMIGDPSEYQWGADRLLRGLCAKDNPTDLIQQDILDSDRLLTLLGGNPKKGLKRYCKLIEGEDTLLSTHIQIPSFSYRSDPQGDLRQILAMVSRKFSLDAGHTVFTEDLSDTELIDQLTQHCTEEQKSLWEKIRLWGICIGRERGYFFHDIAQVVGLKRKEVITLYNQGREGIIQTD